MLTATANASTAPATQRHNTDDDWERFAQANPYFAVLTHERFKGSDLAGEDRDVFFESGQTHIDDIFHVLRSHFGWPEHVDVALDFGCGVGRLLLPLARRSGLALGVDVSPTMLQICAANAKKQGLSNIELLGGSDALANLRRDIDLFTSMIVFQHIPPEIGLQRLRELLARLKPGGCGYVQLTYANEISHIAGESYNPGVIFGYYQRIGDQLVKLAKQTVDKPAEMQMNHYNLNEVMVLLLEHGISDHFARHTNHGGHIGLELFFRKMPS
jgi:SAM-dependent methyltransferase